MTTEWKTKRFGGLLVLMMILPILVLSCRHSQGDDQGPQISWRFVQEIGEQEVLSIAVTQSMVFIGTHEGLFKSHDNGETWESDSFWSNLSGISTKGNREILDYPAEIIPLGDGKTIYVRALASGLYRSEDSGESWRSIFNGIFIPYLEEESKEISGFAFSASKPEILYATVLDYTLIRSVDAGKSWTILHDLVSADHLYVNPSDPSHLILDFSPTIVSLDGGETLIEGNDRFPYPIAIEDFFVDPSEPDRMLVAGMGGMFLSDDGGGSWERIGDDPGSSPPPNTGDPGLFGLSSLDYEWLQNLADSWWITGIAVHPSDKNIIAVCTETEGVILSTDSGQHWAKINPGLPVRDGEEILIAYDIEWSSDGSRLFLTTVNGLFILGN